MGFNQKEKKTNPKLDSFSPNISCSELDQGSIEVFKSPNSINLSIRYVKQLDVHEDTDGNLYLVATLSDEQGDTYLLVRKILEDGSFAPEEHKIKVTYDSAVGAKCHYKTSRCWKGFRNHIYFFTMENYRQEKFWKMNVQTG